MAKSDQKAKNSEENEDFLKKQQRLQAEATMALAQVSTYYVVISSCHH
jgi:hypothetical protein